MRIALEKVNISTQAGLMPFQTFHLTTSDGHHHHAINTSPTTPQAFWHPAHQTSTKYMCRWVVLRRNTSCYLHTFLSHRPPSSTGTPPDPSNSSTPSTSDTLPFHSFLFSTFYLSTISSFNPQFFFGTTQHEFKNFFYFISSLNKFFFLFFVLSSTSSSSSEGVQKSPSL